MRIRIYSIFITLLLGGGRLSAQLYPVDAFLSTQMNFPANVTALSSGFGGLNLTLILRDASVVTTEVRLRFYLEKNGVQLVTNNDAIFAPFTLIANTPVVLTGADLQSYFLPQNFQIIEGLSKETFLRSGGDLPEGLYTICVEVLDFRRFTEAPLSDRICSLTSMDLLDPPLITTPYDDQILEVFDSLVQQPVDINWLMNYSTMVFPVDYQLYIYPYDEAARAFGQGNDFFSRPPLFETYIHASTLTLNNYIFGVSGEVEMLQLGEQYVVRIQATSPDQSVYFRNQGFSDPVVFQYGSRDEGQASPCTAPVIINAAALSEEEFTVSWTEVPEALEYTVVIRQAGELYDSIVTNETVLQLTSLDPELTYEGVIWVTCREGDRLSSAPFYITTNRALPTVVFECGLPAEPLLKQNVTPLPGLQPGDTIVAGDFKVKMLEVTGGSGTFSGAGVMVWNFPFRNVLNPGEDPLAVNITFDQIKVNTDYFMYDGYMQVQGVGVNLVPPVLADFLREFGGLDFVADDYKQGPDLLEVDFAIGAMSIQLGSILIEGTNEDGPTSITIPWDGQDIEIFDSEGNVYVVDEDGNWSLVGELAEGGPSTSTNTDGVDANGDPTELVQAGVVFEAGTGRYAFDDVDPEASEAERRLYPATQVSGSEDLYYSAYKAILKGADDRLMARIVGQDIHPDSLVFKTKSGRKIEHSGSGSTLTIEVKGLFSSATEIILACLKTGGKQELIGTFRLMHIPGQSVNVVLVPLGAATVPSDMAQAIQDIFDPVAIDLDIGTHPSLPFPADLLGPDGAIDTEGSSTFANYSQEQQDINQYIRDQLGDAYNTSTYYLLVTGTASSTNLAGYMPLARQFGYLFSDGADESKSTLAITAAHELGHGIFGMEHPFSRFSIPQGTTDWLMDYSKGTALPHVHWAQMYDPEFRLYLFQGEEEGEQIVASEAFIYSNYVYFANSENPKDNFAALTPSGHRFILPSEAIAAFYPNDDGRWPQGALAGFQIGLNTYYGWWSKEKQLFMGYAQGSLNQDHIFKKVGDYVSSLKEQPVAVFAGKASGDCMQEIVWRAEGSPAQIFSESSVIQSQLSLVNFESYETAEVPQTNCGCYVGECAELLETYKNHPYLTTDNIFKEVICANPCVLKDLESFPFFLEPTSEWMENLNNICASLLAFGFSPVILVGVAASTEGILTPILRGILAQSAETLALKFTIGSTVDMLLQTGINYYFADDEAITWEEAKNQVDLISCFASGVEATLLLQGNLEEAGVAAAISCFIDGSIEEGKIRDNFDVAKCAQGALSALAVEGVLGLSRVGLTKLKSLAVDRWITGFLKLFNNGPPGTYAAGFQADGRVLWSALSFLLPNPMTTHHVKGLFKIEDDQLAEELVQSLQDPQLRSDFLESGYFLKIFNLDMPSNVKVDFVRDLLSGKEFRDALRENEGLVRGWEVMSIDDFLRRDIKQLEVLSRYLEVNPQKSAQLTEGFASSNIRINYLRDALTGFYTTKISWGIMEIDARPFDKGFLGTRIPQNDLRVDAYEMKISPNDESFYLPHPQGGVVQFENIDIAKIQDGKLVLSESSIYHVAEKPEFLNIQAVYNPAVRQLEAANSAGYRVQWLVSDQRAVDQLSEYFDSKNLDIEVKYFEE